MGKRVLQCLEHMHKESMLHRDIKSDNIMVRCADGEVKLMDFGFGCKLKSSSGGTMIFFPYSSCTKY